MTRRIPYKQIGVPPELYERLRERGHMGQSFSGIISELLDLADKVASFGHNDYYCPHCRKEAIVVKEPHRLQVIHCPMAFKALVDDSEKVFCFYSKGRCPTEGLNHEQCKTFNDMSPCKKDLPETKPDPLSDRVEQAVEETLKKEDGLTK